MTPRDEPEPLDLGTVTPPPADGDMAGPAADHGTSGATGEWRRRIALVATLFVGIVVGAVVADLAREDTDQAASRIAAGSVSFGSARAGDPESLAVSLYNTGTDDVHIVGVDVDGFSRRADGTADSMVTVSPGTWTEVDTPPVDADCDTQPSGNVHLDVETTSGEQFSRTLRLHEHHLVDYFWNHSCTTAMGSGLTLGAVTLHSSSDASATFTMRLRHESGDAARITDLTSATAGFSAVADGLPLEIRPGGTPVELDITWTVEDCAATSRLSKATIEFDFTAGEAQRRVGHELGPAVLVELARVAERTCRT